jgi:two-component system LytT family response regulator
MGILAKNRFSCIIVEDDEASRLILENYIRRIEFLDLKCSLESGRDALHYLVSNPETDILLLDINMPEMTGLELIKALPSTPETIFITTEGSHAVEAFDLRAQDYLVKPVSFERFARAIHRACEGIGKNKNIPIPESGPREIFVKSNSRYHKVAFDDILYVEALADYVLVHTPGIRHIVYSTMKAIEEKLSGSTFMRIHRSFIINRDKIQQIEGGNVLVNGKLIPISKTYQDQLFESLNFL